MTQSAEERAPEKVAKAGGNAHINHVAPDAFMGGIGATAEGGRLAVRRLVLTDFRCYRQARLAGRAPPGVFPGADGAGKTKLRGGLTLPAPAAGRAPGRPGGQ